MAQATAQQLYRRPVIRGLVSEIKTPYNRMQEWLGMGPGGPNEQRIGGSQATWDIFNRARDIATIRSPKRGPAKIDLDPSSQKTAVFLRSFESYTIHEDDLYNFRPMGAPWTAPLDERGQDYIRNQQINFIQRFRNLREYAIMGMMKGGFDVKRDGDYYIPVAKNSGNWTIDFGIPAENLDDYHGTLASGSGAASAAWGTAGTNIIKELFAMNAKSEERSGYPIRHIWCNSVTGQYFLNNTGLQSAAGTANTVFQRFVTAGPASAEGIPATEFEIVLRGMPHLTVHVYDGGLEVDGTYTQFFPDGYCLFLPDPRPELFKMQLGSEVVRRNWNDGGFMAYGFNQWATPCIDPAGFEQKTLDRFLPVPFVPETIIYLKVHYAA